MKPRLVQVSLLASMLAISSCAEPPQAPAAPEAPAVAEKPPFKKKPRMNGRGEVTSISLDQFFELHQSGRTMVFDARLPFFYSLGHIPGAINLPVKNCSEAIHNRESEIKAALAEGKVLVVYCSGRTCPDARSVARHLSGYTFPASVFGGGWDEWKDAGLPTE